MSDSLFVQQIHSQLLKPGTGGETSYVPTARSRAGVGLTHSRTICLRSIHLSSEHHLQRNGKGHVSSGGMSMVFEKSGPETESFLMQ